MRSPRLYLILTLLLLPLSSFSQRAVTYEQAPLSIVTHDATLPFTVEIAKTPAQHEYGLMYRTEIPDKHGMIFIFPEPQFATFWMKNTLVPLDMIFISGKGKVTQISENAAPQSLDRITSTSKVLATIEVAGGTAKKYNIAVGDKIIYPLFP